MPGAVDNVSPLYSTTSSQASTPNGHSLTSSVDLSGRGDGPTSSSSPDGDDVPLNSPKNGISRSVSGADSGIATAAGHGSEESVADFLMRIDSSISKTKNQVTRVEGKLTDALGPSDSCSDFLRFSNGRSSGHSASRLSHSHRKSHNGSATSLTSNGSSDLSHTTVITQGRKVKTSLRRLAKQQDELFEL